jgi:transcription antitermination factor NusG
MNPANHIGWYVVITRWGQWKKVSERLAALGVAFFIPSTYNTLIFLHTGKDKALNLVNSGEVKGRFIVDHATRSILEVPDKQMEAFIKVVTEYPDAPVTNDFPISKGTRVKVVRGPLKGIEGEVEETPKGVQLVVGIESLICTRITIARTDVVPVDKNPVQK